MFYTFLFIYERAIAICGGQRTSWSHFSPPTVWDPGVGFESSEGGWCDKRSRGGRDDIPINWKIQRIVDNTRNQENKAEKCSP